MRQGHRGANHPVKRLADDTVEITSMNHGFAVDNIGLPDTLEETHVSLFDGTNCGIAVKGKRAFGVQYHPEASPGAAGQLSICLRSSWGCSMVKQKELEALVLQCLSWSLYDSHGEKRPTRASAISFNFEVPDE